MDVDALFEPGSERSKLAPLDLGGDLWDIGQGLIVELHRQQGAQGISGKISDGAKRPVYVLQHALGIVGRDDAQIGFHLCVPRLGQLRQFHFPLQHVVLDLEAQENVQVVGHLVGFDADHARLDFVNCSIERLQVHPIELLGEELLEAGEIKGPEAPAAPYHVFPQAGLRFVDSQ